MDSKDIHAACLRMERALSERGFAWPEVGLHINWIGTTFQVSLEFDRIPCFTREIGGNRTSEYCDGDTPEDAIAKADAYLASLPDSKDKHRDEFIGALSRLIDRGREFGIDEKLIAPVVDGRDLVAERLLTYRPGSE